MKNLLAFAFAATLSVGMISCGPSEEKKNEDSLEADSIAKEIDNTTDHLFDSMNRADSLSNLKLIAQGDSLRKADSIKNLKK
ncbi:MAG: hypothetical protein M3R17_17735 [Bacteroidota bacterium]|nr:hypothetical protein [Bacteroidota bacterium]